MLRFLLCDIVWYGVCSVLSWDTVDLLQELFRPFLKKLTWELRK